ncbi:hypothetical protein [Nonomuraea soli]|uniref:Lipoprotein n=1 Tax=Nonomuraea soli TaxID=1032476 RepID=A0A7W0CNI0_9ACTN|nr:hypothetical protein [Nonomuraea soli]MBA2894448.1 hypothetical protein [Nonomuraea soli]
MKKHLVAAMLIAAASLTACSNGQKNSPATVDRSAFIERAGRLDVSLLRLSEADFSAYKTPEALAADRPIVLAGVIDGWQQGPATETYTNGPLGYRVILRIRITEPLKGVKGTRSLAPGVAYIALDQGAVTQNDSEPADEWIPEKSVADFEKAMPTGTRILAYPREMPQDALAGATRITGDRLPRGARLMTVPPQGLVLEDPTLAKQRAANQTALVGGREPLATGGAGWYEAKTMDELIGRLKAHGYSE